ncbi:hypothetical protein [Alteromonas sp. a30]|uniref:hypothetical protein n=1 Tax=Alteromonas sp. a30 TaxID=2730917 RepID=UPI00228290FE|nr:hypothetical protein [Alteromonas sp. a30]MCY7297257.1 hypothetical protein [Alteromonas sp. a30]
MSYLNNVHMVFSGRFQSDVSTVNNEVTHFDNETFEPRFQEYGNENGWWNPCGSGAFRLIDCRVTQVGYANGATTSDKKEDPVIGMLIGGSNEQTSAKMVDLDPQMQLVSEIWGLTMRLTDGKTPHFFEGKFLPAPFRDISFTRIENSAGDIGASAIYQSVLEDLTWVDTDSSPFLQELKALSEKVGKLSVRMMVYGYNMTHSDPEFTLGQVSGVIGPALENEPDTFISGRRFAPANGNVIAQSINFFNAKVNTYYPSVKAMKGDVGGQEDNASELPSHSLNVDFSNALPLINSQGVFANLGQLQLVVLTQDFGEETMVLSPKFFVPVGDPIAYLQHDWLKQTGGLVSIPISEGLLPTLNSGPLALLRVSPTPEGIAPLIPQEGASASLPNNTILIRETQEGVLVRSDNVVHRLNPATQSQATFYASQYGIPTSLDIEITLQPRSQGTSGGPRAPFINHPASAIQFTKSLSIPATGNAVFTFEVTDPKNPRGYIDGQLFFLSYTPVGYADYAQYQYDFIASLVFDTFEVPDSPTWADVKDFMTQYGNLYPVMSRMLVDLSDYDSVVKFRALLELAFTLPQRDPNFMPVTRDLSAGKRQTIIKWLTEKDANGNYVLARGPKNVPAPEKAATETCNSCEIDDDLPTVDSVTAQTKTTAQQSHSLKGQNLTSDSSTPVGSKTVAHARFINSKKAQKGK